MFWQKKGKKKKKKKKNPLWLYKYEIKFLKEIQPNWEFE